ncbi:MAG TPA: hypothetical protein VJL57_03355 [Candidatus Paceibacterota bacterium]
MWTVIYYALFTPVALVVRAFGYDPLRLKKRAAQTAFIDRNHEYSKVDFENT